MSNVQVFNNPEFGKVRTVVINEEPWFVGKDVAVALGYSLPTKAVSNHVDEEDKKMGIQNGTPYIEDSLGRKQYPVFINESGVYTLIISSKLPTAKKFKHWVTSEVLPSIRKYGSYFVDVPKTLPECLIAYANEIKAREETKKMLEIAKPKAEFYDTVANSKSLMSMAAVAKVLDKGIGRNKLYRFLRDKKVLMSDNLPYQTYVDRGYFKVVEGSYTAGGSNMVSKTTYVKQKGVDYIRKLLAAEKSVTKVQ